MGNEIARFAIRWGGAAGDGLQSTGLLQQKYLNRLGYHVRGFPGTQSTIRGGHVWQHVEFASQEFASFDRPIDLLVALNDVTLLVHTRDLKQNGLLIVNQDLVDPSEYQDLIYEKNIQVCNIPLTELSREIDIQTPVLANTIAMGAILCLLSLPKQPYVETLSKRFRQRPAILEKNITALQIGYDYYEKNFSKRINLKDPTNSSSSILISGNEMIALGAVASGLKFLAQYPITPASSILTYLSNRAEKYGIVVRQAEDELAAINMTIGAAFAGARAMTASSGPGLSLMAESFGYASMTETPIVVVNSMRGGPSTGIPTKMEQSDLNSMIHLSHGEGPRAILAPRTIEEAFELTVKAFNIADRFQIPVIILSDFSLSERTKNLAPFDMDVVIDRGKIWTGPSDEFPTYSRYALTKDGVSPRAFPPTPDAQYILVGAEHDEASHSLSGNRCGLPRSWELKELMTHKRFKKLALLQQELQGPDTYGPSIADYTLLCWGSITGAVHEAVDFLNHKGPLVFNVLSFAEVYPLPKEKVIPHLEKVNKAIMIEVNYTGQFEDLLYLNTGWQPDHSIHPWTGETPTASMILEAINDYLEGEL